MSLIDLRDSLILPFLGLLIFAGTYLSIKLGPIQIRYLFPAIKILTGSLDEMSRGHRLSPAQAFSAGTASSMVPGSIIGAALATSIYGPGILAWIFLSSFFVMPILFGASALAVRYRTQSGKSTYLAGPSVYVEKSLRNRWLSRIISIALILTSFISGNALLFVYIRTALQARFPWLSSLTIASVLAILVALIFLGGMKRIGYISRKFVPLGFFLTILGSFIILGEKIAGSGEPFSHFAFAMHAFPLWLPKHAGEGSRLLLALAVYHSLSETANGKLATLSGCVRTDLPAKQGFAAMMAPLISAVFVAPFGVISMTFLMSDLSLPLLSSPGFVLFSADSPLSTTGTTLLLVSLLLFLIPGLSAWAHAGGQSARYLSGESGFATYTVTFMGLLITMGYLFDAHLWIDAKTILNAGILAGLVSALFPLLAIILLRDTILAELQVYEISRTSKRSFMEELTLLLLVLLPKNIISRIAGWITRIPVPVPLREAVIGSFAKLYRINLQEAEHPLKEYSSINHFFTRALRPGARPIDEDPMGIVSPVDAHITQFGDIRSGRIIQAKGIDYAMEDLLDWDDIHKNYYDGKYAVLYLSPQDYHRIHSPVDGMIRGYGYNPGKLFTVNSISVDGVHGLFPKNERLTTYIQTAQGLICVIKVGATNVGKISIKYEKFSTNKWIRFPRTIRYKQPIPVKKGEEIARFEMGSTVILLFEKGMFEFKQGIKSGDTVRIGKPIGQFKTTGLPRHT